MRCFPLASISLLAIFMITNFCGAQDKRSGAKSIGGFDALADLDARGELDGLLAESA